MFKEGTDTPLKYTDGTPVKIGDKIKESHCQGLSYYLVKWDDSRLQVIFEFYWPNTEGEVVESNDFYARKDLDETSIEKIQ